MLSREEAEGVAAGFMTSPEPHPWRAFFLQTTFSWCILVALQIVMAVFDFGFFHPQWDGGLATIGAPIGAALFAVTTNLVAVILGLPFRFVPAANRWIRAHHRIPAAVAAGGSVLIVISYLLGHVQSGIDDLGNPYTEFDQNLVVFLIGWLLIALGVTHYWTPYMQRDLPDPSWPVGTYPIPPLRSRSSTRVPSAPSDGVISLEVATDEHDSG